MKGKEPSILEDVPAEKLENFTQETAYIEIPKDIRSLKERKMNEAIEWRAKTRALFEQAFQKGYVAEDIVFSKDKKRIFFKLKMEK
jgi:predicted GNAT superfamily acetyltransferase